MNGGCRQRGNTSNNSREMKLRKYFYKLKNTRSMEEHPIELKIQLFDYPARYLQVITYSWIERRGLSEQFGSHGLFLVRVRLINKDRRDAFGEFELQLTIQIWQCVSYMASLAVQDQVWTPVCFLSSKVTTFGSSKEESGLHNVWNSIIKLRFMGRNLQAIIHSLLGSGQPFNEAGWIWTARRHQWPSQLTSCSNIQNGRATNWSQIEGISRVKMK